MSNTEVAVRSPEEQALDKIQAFEGYFGKILPVQFRAETFVRLAQGLLRKEPKLMRAAIETPASLMVALVDCSRLGHEPGTSDYWLTPRYVYDKNLRAKRWEVVGFEGYKGMVKRMLQHPTVMSVEAEIVCEADRFTFVKGRDKVPTHEVEWFGDRGETLGSYAYAMLHGGYPSNVVVIGPREIARAKKASAAAQSDKESPWDTDYDTMVLKTGLRRLEKFVAKSAEVIFKQADRTAAALEVVAEQSLPMLPASTDDDTEEVLEGELVPGEPPGENFDDPEGGNR